VFAPPGLASAASGKVRARAPEEGDDLRQGCEKLNRMFVFFASAQTREFPSSIFFGVVFAMLPWNRIYHFF